MFLVQPSPHHLAISRHQSALQSCWDQWNVDADPPATEHPQGPTHGTLGRLACTVCATILPSFWALSELSCQHRYALP